MIPTYLYVDNFRGFEDTLIRLAEVNFLVGENSTGKSSILSLIGLFGNPQFWMEQDFNSPTGGLGHFKEMVSCSSSDKSYFRLGLVASLESVEGRETEAFSAYLFTFSERSGLPQLTGFTTREGNYDITLKLVNNDLYYRATAANYPPTSDELARVLKGRWIEEHKEKADDFDRLSRRSRGGLFRSKFSIPIGSFIDRAYERETKQVPEADRTNSVFAATFLSERIISLAPVRSKPRRTYDEVNRDFSPEGDHTPYLLRDVLSSRRAAPSFKQALKTLGSESGLFGGVQIKKLGTGPTAAFEVDILLDGVPLSISNVGYGVSQAMPILVEVLTRPNSGSFAIQQPEVHLHPRAQAALGELFFRVGATGKTLTIETHSDYMIDRFRSSYRKYPNLHPKAQILYFERTKGRNIVTAIEIGPDGSLPADQPESYRKFFLQEDLKNLGL